MEINTTEIIDTIERILNKPINKITEDELYKIDSLYISRFDGADNLNIIDFNDLKYFKLLKNLTIKKCILNNYDILNISLLASLDSLTLIDCELYKDCSELFQSLNINSLSLSNMDKFNFKWIDSLNSLSVSSMKYIPVSGKINTLNLVYADFDNDIIYNLNVDHLIISEDQYSKNAELYNNLNCKVTVMEDNGTFVKCEVGIV